MNHSHGWPNTMKKSSCAPCMLCPIGPSSSLNVCTATRCWRCFNDGTERDRAMALLQVNRGWAFGKPQQHAQ